MAGRQSYIEQTSGSAQLRSQQAVFTHPKQLEDLIQGLSTERIQEANDVAQAFRFRLPEFYARHVLTGGIDDPLLDLVLPSLEEMQDGPELWDTTPSAYRASKSPFWIQKYEYQGLLRLTTACSGLCRFCYLKQKNAHSEFMTTQDVDCVFDDLEKYGHKLLEIILSGGDPLCAPVDTLMQIGIRTKRLHENFGRKSPHITIHTREPVWNPVRLLKDAALDDALHSLQPTTIMINILHPREVTSQFTEVCRAFVDERLRPALLCQHPLFKGVNDSVETLSELYELLLGCSPPVLPYYLVHPFYNGTLNKHRLSIFRSQQIYRELIRRPGCMTPKLVVPTPWGKCVLGPHDALEKTSEGYVLTTKDGMRVIVP